MRRAGGCYGGGQGLHDREISYLTLISSPMSVSRTANRAIPRQVMALLTAPLATVIEGSIRQIGGFAVVMILGILSVYLK